MLTRLLRTPLVTLFAVSIAAPATLAQSWDDFRSPPRSHELSEADLSDPSFVAGFLETRSGLGVAARGEAWYEPGRDGTLGLYTQRLAFQRALLNAKTRLVDFVEGSSVDAHTALADAASSYDSELVSAMNARMTFDQRIESVTGGVLAGVVVVAMDDRPEDGFVSVTIASSPRTQGATRTSSPGVRYTDDLEDAKRFLFNELRSRVTPPSGGTVLSNPLTGETVWAAYGAMPIAQTDNERLRIRARESAERRAALIAEKNLIAMLRGESVEISAGMSERFKEVIRQFERLSDRFGGGGVRVLDEDAAVTRAEFADERTIGLVVSGVVPPGAERVSDLGDSDEWAHHVVMYTLVRDVAPTRPQRGRAREDTLQRLDDIREETCEGDEPGVRGVIAEGTGETVSTATLRALREAVRRVNGAVLDADQRYRAEFRHVFEGGREEIIGDTFDDETIEATTGGFILGYDVMDVAETRSGYAVEVCVRVPEWEPGWRPGRPTIAVIPIDGPAVYSTEPDAAGPDEVVNVFTSHTNALLLRAGSFRVIDRATIGAARDELAFVEDLVRRGESPVRELTNLGRLLGADYLAIPTLNRIDYRRTRDRIPGQGRRFEWNERLSIDASIRIVETATGQIVAEEPFARTLGGAEMDEIARLDGSRGVGAPLLMGARIAARDGLVAEALGVFCSSDWGGAMTVELIDGDTVYIALSPCASVQIGDVLIARQHLERARVAPRVAELEIVYIDRDSGTIEARILRDDSPRANRLRPGMECVIRP